METLELIPTQARCTRLRKNLGVAAKLLSQGEGGQAWMLTLTYRGTNSDWRPDHIRDSLRHLRQWASRLGFRLRYMWVIETKPRLSGEHKGEIAPHYHVVLWLPRGIDCPRLDDLGWWPHGMTNTVRAKAPVKYIMKYASKFDNTGDFPRGARCYGVGGLDAAGRRFRRWINWPSHVQGNASVEDRCTPTKGGGWTHHGTGQWWAPEWGIRLINRACTVLVRLRTHPRAIESPAGPFSWNPHFQGAAS